MRAHEARGPGATLSLRCCLPHRPRNHCPRALRAASTQHLPVSTPHVPLGDAVNAAGSGARGYRARCCAGVRARLLLSAHPSGRLVWACAVNASWPRAVSGPGPTSYWCVRRCPTLPPGPPGSTIGAGGLSFRVRDGTGRFPAAMTAARSSGDSLYTHPGGRGRVPVNRIVDASSLLLPQCRFELGVCKPSAY